MDQITNGMVLSGFEDMFDYLNYSESPITEVAPSACPTEEESLYVFHTILQPLVFGVVFVLGVVGNGLLLTVLLRRAHLRITEIYLLHLAVSDLLLLLTLPLLLAQAFVGWVFGDFLCRLLGLLNGLNFHCGSLLLACIGFDRYLAIVHAVSSLHGRRAHTGHLTCALLWLLSLAVSAPGVAFLSVRRRHAGHAGGPPPLTCYIHSHGIHASNWLLAKRMLTHLLCFLLPMTVMMYCYSAVVTTLHRSHKSLEKQGAIRLALLLTVVFCLCWLPYNLALLTDTLRLLGLLPVQGCRAQAALTQAVVVTESVGFTHCFLNPILYAFVGVRFRADLMRLLRKLGCGCAVVSGGVSVSEATTSSTTTSANAI